MRQLLLCAFGASAAMALSVACSGDSQGNADSGTGGSGGRTGGTTGGGAGGTGDLGGSGATGDGMGGAGGESMCPSSSVRWFGIASVTIPGYGTWPQILTNEEPDGMGGAGPSAATDQIGCDWEASGYLDSGSLSCSGPATVEMLDASLSLFEATFADGSVAKLSVPGAVLPASGELSLTFTESRTRANPFWIDTSTSSRASDGDQLLWLFSENMSNEVAAELLGAPITTNEVCASEYEDYCYGPATMQVFGRTLATDPEQTIVAGETSRITTDAGTYDVDWYESHVAYHALEFNCADGVPSHGETGFSMVRVEE